MSYLRVAPRDLFNESKLLKCLGRLSLGILDGKLSMYSISDEIDEPEGGFNIDNNDDGDIYCINYNVYVEAADGSKVKLDLFTRLNSKEPYPLICLTHDDEIIDVFYDDGEFTNEFVDYLKLINESDIEEEN